MPFGRIGTVTGIYKKNIEVYFDEPFIGGTDLSGRCDFFRGAVVDFLHIFNLSSWRSLVNTKRSAMEQVKRNYEKTRANKQILPDEQLTEWDGVIDGMRLIQQMMINTSSLNKPREQQAAAPQQARLRRGDDYRPQLPPTTHLPPQPQPLPAPAPHPYGRAGVHQQQAVPQYGFVYGVPAPVPMPVAVPVAVLAPAPVQPAKFETNPKHKLKARDSKPSADDEYVMKKKKGPDSHQAEEYVRKTPVPIDASELESKLKAQQQKAPIDIEDLERQLKSQPKPLDAEELERAMATRK